MKSISNILATTLALLAFSSCNEYSHFEGELYKKVIYVLSSDNNKVFAETHSLNEPISLGHITIYAGGTTPLDQDVTIVLEKDEEQLGIYNLTNFDIDKSKYAKELDPSKYEIPSYEVTLKKESETPYALITVNVKPEGLSPDSAYFIPLKIKSVSAFEVNPARNNVLYRVYLANDYANQMEATQYSMKGERGETGKLPYNATLNKRVFPLTKNKVRTTAGIVVFANNTGFINSNSMVMEVNDVTKKITVTPYNPAFLEIEQIGGDEENYYGPDFMGINRFYIHYKYRTISADGTKSNWINMQESMKRIQ